MQIYYTEEIRIHTLVDRKRDYVPAQTLSVKTTAPTSGSCSGRRQLPAPNDGASRFHTRTVWMTTSGLQIQQSSGSGRVDLAARRCANSRETSLLVRSSRNGTPLKVGENERELVCFPKAKGTYIYRRGGETFSLGFPMWD